ncbi:helix-turn-helix domain-containing protein [Cryptosporangium arvum]|uniref:helix-turn-helix domain-containing protein n=1 Tax=Cryptosporangium arvum TaxID=80871 RepID=UPI0004B582B5|nr:helix-turn-helix domain-containing protein [Cryptosporangium arvum]
MEALENLAGPRAGARCVARVSGPALRAAFREQYGTTPTGYLRRVRMDGAHRDLLAAGPARTTVDQVAARWGFADGARFAAYHRRHYGVPPSRTLGT